MRTVFFTIPGGPQASLVLRSSTFEILKREAGLRLVVVSPLTDDKRFVEEFQDENVFVEELRVHTPGRGEALALRLARESFVRPVDIETFRIRLAAARAVRGWSPLRRCGALGLRLLRRLPPPLWYRAADRFVRDEHTRGLFARYAPDLVVSMKAGLQLWEVPALVEARRRGVPTAVIGLSWDNLTTKMLPLRRVNRLIVWNEWMKREAIAVQGYAEEAVAVSGIPHFDHYHDRGRRAGREAFFQRVGLDPSRPLLVLATCSDLVSTECRMEELIDIVHEAAASGAFGAPVQILVRVHPRDRLEKYRAFMGRPGVVVEKPFHAWTVDGRVEENITREDLEHLADTLCHMDLLVNIFSTVMIEACIFDKPVINVAFDGRAEHPYLLSARRFQDYTHLQRVIASGGVRVAQTPAELVAQVRFSLEHPEADREGRRRIVSENCYLVDGRSGERQARLILECLSRKGPHG